ncbi:Uncharacterised protein [Amycolatopsis camponoti]|uniref:Uncharacterized protein n=1 Tax=Amycolatopsis camponoti TaxID=2606593 RepID=A0A6I8LJB6_9PSEU|nr:Uncharacterised protein [Amycolatopsis camponoti]
MALKDLLAASTGRLADRIATVGDEAADRADDVAWRVAKLSDRAAGRLGDYAADASRRVANTLVRLGERVTSPEAPSPGRRSDRSR